MSKFSILNSQFSIFNYLGRTLQIVPSKSGCTGCYFSQKGSMNCRFHAAQIEPCSKDERPDRQESIFLPAGPHLRITRVSSPDPDFWNCTPMSVHPILSQSSEGAQILGQNGTPIFIPRTAFEPLRVTLRSNYSPDPSIAFRKGQRLDYLSPAPPNPLNHLVDHLSVSLSLTASSSRTIPLSLIDFSF